MDGGCIRPLTAVSGKLQVDRRRQGPGIRDGHSQELSGLYQARGAQREEVIRPPIQAGFAGAPPVLEEPTIDEVTTPRWP